MLWGYLFYSVTGFLLGNILFSYHLPKLLAHVDTIQDSEDHNPGTYNAFRMAGIPIGILCLLCDMAKAFFPVWLAARHLDITCMAFALVMVAPVLGHALAPMYPRGGKGIACAFGELSAMLPTSNAVFLLAVLYIFFSVVVVIHPNEKRSVATFLCLGAGSWIGAYFTTHYAIALGCTAIALVAANRNRINIPVRRQYAPGAGKEVEAHE